MFGLIFVALVKIALVILVALVLLILMAAIHTFMLEALRRLFGLFVGLFAVLLHAVQAALDGLGALIERALADLHKHHGNDEGSWSGWTIIGSLIFLTLLLAISASDFYYMLLRLAGLLAITSISYDPGQLDLVLGVAFILVFVTIGLGWADLEGLSPMRIFHRLSEHGKRIIRWVMLGSMILALLTVIALMLYSSEAMVGQSDPALAGVVMACYGVLLLVATFIAGIPMFSSIAAVFIVLIGLLRLMLWLVGYVIYLPYLVLCSLRDFILRVVLVMAALGALIWNRLASKHTISVLIEQHPEDKRMEHPRLSRTMAAVEVASGKNGQVKAPTEVVQTPDR